jgi:hypothetical protein
MHKNGADDTAKGAPYRTSGSSTQRLYPWSQPQGLILRSGMTLTILPRTGLPHTTHMPITKTGHPIATLADWERHAPPKSSHHWVDGRSAKEVARAWISGAGTTLPEEVHALLSSHPRFGPVLSWDCEPEAKLRFDSFPGEPRNSDLCVIAADSVGPYVLAVEAKADEPYGETLAEAFAAALERRIENPRSNGIARIEGLAALLLRPRTATSPKADVLRYQLLTACAGAVAEAVRRKVTRAVMLVHEFITPATVDKNHDRNAGDLQQFLHRLAGDPVERLIDGQLYGPFSLPGAHGIELFVGKVKRNLRVR